MSLKGKSAIVTGSTSGIGRAIAEAFAAEGCNVMLNGFGEQAGIARQREDMAKKNGVKVEYNGADMSKPAEIAALVAGTKAAFGGVDILVNNAGIQFTAPIEQFPPEKWDAIIAVNLSATFHAIHAALPLMKARKWGRIVNIASTHGLVASAHKAAYVAAKHGLLGLARAAAKEGARIGVRTNVICPGFVRTPLVEKQIPEQARTLGISEEEVVKKVMLGSTVDGEFTTLEDIAQLAIDLAAFPSAALTGQLVAVSHGWHMH